MGELLVTVTTWDKPNYELFDGESENHRVKEFLIKQAGIFCRNLENEVYFEENGKTCYENRLLLSVQIEDGQFVFGRKDGMEDLWIQSTNEQQIRQNDIIKLGKKELRVISINNDEGLQMTHYQDFCSQINNYNSSISDETPQNDNQCRICLGHSHSAANPLMSLCQCCGSAKYVHFQCLQTWLSGKMQVKSTQYCLEINSKSVRCEICLSFYPSLIYSGSNVFVLYNIENLNLRHHTLLVLNFEDQEILTIGRGHESNVKISEITISRKHVEFVVRLCNLLSIRDDKLYIQDKKSKFGTLIKVQRPQRLEDNQTLFLQSGRSRIMVKHKVTKKRCALFCNCVE